MDMVNSSCSALAVFVLISASLANAKNVQVTLHSETAAFSIDEEINLCYEVLWRILRRLHGRF